MLCKEPCGLVVQDYVIVTVMKPFGVRIGDGAEQPELLRTLRGLRKTQGAAFLFRRGFKNL